MLHVLAISVRSNPVDQRCCRLVVVLGRFWTRRRGVMIICGTMLHRMMNNVGGFGSSSATISSRPKHLSNPCASIRLTSPKQVHKLTLRLWAICTHSIHILYQTGTFKQLSAAKLLKINLHYPSIRPYLTDICHTSTYLRTVSRFVLSELGPCSSSNLPKPVCISFQCEYENPISHPIPNQKHLPSPSKPSNPNRLGPQHHQIRLKPCST